MPGCSRSGSGSPPRREWMVQRCGSSCRQPSGKRIRSASAEEENDMPYCEVAPDVRLYYEDFGEGQPIVLICGANLTHKSWESQVAALAPEFRTVAFDWRGSGASDRPRSGYSAETATADLCTLMERLA